MRGRWLVVALAVAGCGTGGAWSNDGFSQTTYGWKASYPPGASALLGADWRVDNWGKNPDGTYAEKTGPGFTIGVDEFLYDLKLAHVPDEGVIWVKTRTLAEPDARKSLEMLSDGFLRGRGAGSLAGLGFSAPAVTARRETSLGGRRALAVSLNAQVKSTPDGERRRIDLLVTKYEYELPDTQSSAAPTLDPATGPATPAKSGRSHFATAFMVIGYVNAASRFDAARGDLDKLVARLTWSPTAGHAAEPPPTPEDEGESRWTATGFEQRRYGWKASYAPGNQDFVSADWRLQEGSAQSGYTGSADLSFENIHDNGFIWTDTSALSMDEATKDLDVLFESYVGRLAQVGFGGKAVIASREEIKLGAYPAVSAIVEREPTAAEREGRIKTIATQLRIVVTKFDYVERPQHAGAAGDRRVALMVIGYANDSSRFADGLEDFVHFLGRLSWPPPPPGSKPAPQPRAPSKPADPNQPTLETLIPSPLRRGERACIDKLREEALGWLSLS